MTAPVQVWETSAPVKLQVVPHPVGGAEWYSVCNMKKENTANELSVHKRACIAASLHNAR